MTGFISALIIVLLLGILITVHELGHFLAARFCGIRVREFAIGMGPALFSRQKKDDNGEPLGTKFTLRALPIGGYCDMGEDEANDDPSHFRNKGIGRKCLTLLSGALMNLLLGFIFMLVLACLGVGRVADRIPVIDSVEEECPYDFQRGDRFYKINGHRIYGDMDFQAYFPSSADAGPVTFVMLRDGKKVTLSKLTRFPISRPDEEGNMQTELRFGIIIGYDVRDIAWADVPRQACTLTYNSVRLIWFSLGQLITGKVGVGGIMGPVGMGGVVNDMISEPRATAFSTLYNILALAGLVAVNLAVVNLLPIPALDGGRIIFLFISALLVLARKKPLSAKIEGYIHGVTMLLLFALMALIFFNDVRRLIGL